MNVDVNESKFISIVVPTRNRAALLRDCILSLVSQEYAADGYEIIVVDDGSSDGTALVVREFSTTRTGFPEIRYVRSSRQGLNVARNEGVNAARGDLILFLDDDVLAPHGWLTAFHDGSLRHPTVECFGGPVRLRLDGKPPRLCPVDGLYGGFDLGEKECCVDFVGGGNMAVRRAVIERIGQFNELLSGFGDEIEWELRLLNNGGLIVYLPEAWIWHRRSKDDIRLWPLLRVRFRRAVEEIAFAKLVGRPIQVGRELLSIPRFLAHAVRRRCAGGLFSVSTRAGHAWGVLLWQVRRLRDPASNWRPPVRTKPS